MRLFGKAVNRVDVVAKRVWRISWGLAFVCTMTVLSECIPQSGRSRASSATTHEVSQQNVHHFIK